jgi:hypothetical protein
MKNTYFLFFSCLFFLTIAGESALARRGSGSSEDSSSHHSSGHHADGHRRGRGSDDHHGIDDGHRRGRRDDGRGRGRGRGRDSSSERRSSDDRQNSHR